VSDLVIIDASASTHPVAILEGRFHPVVDKRNAVPYRARQYNKTLLSDICIGA